MINCLNCGDITKNPKFCSKSCSATYNNRMYPKRSPEGNCKTCNQVISSGRTYCSDCYTVDFSQLTYAEVSGRRMYQKNSRIRDDARNVYKKLDRPKYCLVCQYSLHIEICHIVGISSYPQETPISAINNPSNLIGLCPNCHWELDHGHIDVDKIRQLIS